MSTIEESIRSIIREELAAIPLRLAALSGGEPAAPKPRGRPARGESAAAAATASSTTTTASSSPAPSEPDPFDSAAPAAATAPTATEEEVRAALTALKDATTQDNAVKVLRESSGVDNLTELRKTPEKFGLVVAAAKKALPAVKVVPPAADPFEADEAPAAKPLTIEDVKAICVAAGKRTSQDNVQKLLIDHGGSAKNAATGTVGPSLKALDPAKYAAFVAAVNALPTTK